MRTLTVITLIAAVFGSAGSLQAQYADNQTLPVIVYGTDGNPVAMGNKPYLPCAADRSWVPDAATDDITMVQIGTLAGPLYYTMTGGDSDQDGLFEAYMYIRDNQGTQATFTYRIYENDGNDNYPLAFAATAGLIPYAFGDTDGDSLPEVIGQWSSWLYVYESPAPGRLATQMVWQSPPTVNVTGYTAIGDLDQDGHGEIIHTQNSFGSDNRLLIYESTGNNQYQLIYNQWVSNASLGTKAIADFDGDGQQEIAFTSGNGDVYVYECTGPDTFVQTFHGHMNTYNAYACSYANDMDGNGRPEFICSGSDGTRGWVTQIYEATGNDQYAVQQEIVLWDGYFGVPGNAVGDLDGDGADEFVIQLAQALRLYKWNGQQYSPAGTIPENFGYIQHGIFSYDGNHNNYDEIFWLGLGDSGYWTNLSILLEDQNAGTPPDVTIALAPLNPPIILPPGGGSFSYNITVHNNDTSTVNCDVWVMIQLPDSSWYGPVLQAFDRPIGAGATISRNRTQMVPGNAPAGTYHMVGYVGDYPNVIWDQSGFPFAKAGAGDLDLGTGENKQSSFRPVRNLTTPLDGWENWGEDFGEELTMLPSEFKLNQNYPNPFNAETVIPLALPQRSQVKIELYNLCGQKVATVFDGVKNAGIAKFSYQAANLASGVYFYKVQATGLERGGTYSEVRKMLLLK